MNNSKPLVVITGGTRGIGNALVLRFAKKGHPIVTCARNEEALEALRSEVREKYGVALHCCVADLSIREDIATFLQFVGRINESVEILINNTGVFIAGSVLSEKEGTLEHMMKTNLYSAYYLTRGLVPLMKKGRGGHIFNLCSVASINAYPNGGSYSISKFALYGFSKALREELKEAHIRVTSVLSGAVKTSSWSESTLPEDRFIHPKDIADTIYSTYALSKRTVIEEILVRPQLGDI